MYQPVYAAWLNLIEPWWKTRRSLAFTGRRFETWEERCRAVERATAYCNAHKHPFVWGRRRRHRPRRKPGIALGANVRPTRRMHHYGTLWDPESGSARSPTGADAGYTDAAHCTRLVTRAPRSGRVIQLHKVPTKQPRESLPYNG